MVTHEQTLTSHGAVALEKIVRSFPSIVENLRSSYAELEVRAAHVEDELCRTNDQLAEKVAELDGLRQHLEEVFESLPCGVVVRDALDEIVEVNSKAQSLLGLSAAELRSLGGHPALQGERSQGRTHEVITRQGKRLVVANSYSPVRRGGGRAEGSVEILDDHTERVRMAERLHAADKMAALGTMAAGVAHEIRNPLNAIKGFAQLLLRRPNQDTQAQRWCRLIVEASTEANGIIESMLSFGSPDKLLSESIDGKELLESALGLAVPEGADATRLDVNLECSAGRFVGDRIKLRQALRNLIANAIKAQSDRVEAKIDIQLTHEEDDLIVRVSDAGPGIESEIRQLIFDPFFTNHPDGTGLGLALVSIIVHLHGGSVRVSPEPSPLGGAEFIVRIPFQPAPTPSAHPTSSPEG